MTPILDSLLTGQITQPASMQMCCNKRRTRCTSEQLIKFESACSVTQIMGLGSTLVVHRTQTQRRTVCVSVALSLIPVRTQQSSKGSALVLMAPLFGLQCRCTPSPRCRTQAAPLVYSGPTSAHYIHLRIQYPHTASERVLCLERTRVG